jgi:hypothetical protein
MDPSGTHIAYVRTHIDGVYEVEGQVAGPYHAPDLYIMDADGANPRKLAENATNPSWILREE